MSISKNTRRSGLIAAAVIFVIAMIWLALLESSSYTRALCVRLKSFGYSVSPSDFYTQGYGANTSIEQVMQGELTAEEIAKAVSLSKESGFSADITKVGTVELMLMQLGSEKVMIVYLTDKTPQLAFIEDRASGTISALGEP
ncbi:MAG: hypothetical protein II897_08625 [Clostridia bacterium]|nr:hypothetical protein [Clostridia bacterium]